MLKQNRHLTEGPLGWHIFSLRTQQDTFTKSIWNNIARECYFTHGSRLKQTYAEIFTNNFHLAKKISLQAFVVQNDIFVKHPYFLLRSGGSILLEGVSAKNLVQNSGAHKHQRFQHEWTFCSDIYSVSIAWI